MGGGNGQKSAIARLKNQKDAGKTPEERKAASAKAAKDASAFICTKCRDTFMVNVKPPTLYLHCTAKHPDLDPVACFASLKDFDPEDPKGLKKAAAEAAAKKKAPPKKKKGAKEEGLDDLLSAGLSIGKKKASKQK